MTVPDTIVDALEAGKSVIPLRPDKKPFVPWKPFQSQPPTKEQVEAWAFEHDPPLWGIVCGPVSGFIVLDFDGETGNETMRKLGLDPHFRTPSGGHHVYVVCPEWKIQTLNSKSQKEIAKEFPGLDIRACGGYAAFLGRSEKGEYANMRSLRDAYRFEDLPERLRKSRWLSPPAPINGNHRPTPVAVPDSASRVPADRLIRKALDEAASNGRNNGGFLLACQCRDNGYSQSEAESVLLDYQRRTPATNQKGEPEAYTRAEALASVREAYSASPREPWTPKRNQTTRARAATREEPPISEQPSAEREPRILDRTEPLTSARQFIRDEFTRNDRQILHYHRADFYRWTRTRYAPYDDAELRAHLYTYCEAAQSEVHAKDGSFLEPFKPNPKRISEIVDALKAAAILPTALQPPAWLEQVADLPPGELIPCSNGLLNLSDLELIGHDPAFFNTSVIDVAYNPDAPEPELWLWFLRSLWGDDAEAIACLQEIFGYLLTCDTRQQKIFLVVGPKRSGKGTITRILTALVGPENVAAPTLASLGTNFGLAPLIGRQVATIADARLSGRTDLAAVVENLLSISGEDCRTIDRKHRDAWTGTLPTRFLMLTNELPRLADSSGALAGRFIVLTLTESFYGKEDTTLTDRLKCELPGILNWSLAGLLRLRERGRFEQPGSSADAIQQLEDLGSPVKAFLAECCEIAPGATVDMDPLFDAWKQWCGRQNRDHPGIKQTFGRDIQAAVPALKVRQRREARKVVRYYEGIMLA